MHLNKIIGIALLLLLGACVTTPSSPMATPPVPVSGTSGSTNPTRLVDLGLAAAKGADFFHVTANSLDLNGHATVYYTLGSSAPLPYIRFNPATPIIMVVKFPEGPGVLAKVINGEFDEGLSALANAINTAGRPITLRLANEFNGSWYSHGVYAKGGNAPEQFVPAWRHMVDLLRKVAPNYAVGFDLNYNRGSDGGRGTSDFAILYPGDEYVTSVSISTYNRCGLDESHTTPKSAAEELRPAYDVIAKLTARPIWIAEISTTDFCGVDKIQWFHDLYEALIHEFTRIENVTFFFETVPAGNTPGAKPSVWGIPENQWEAFRAETDRFRDALGLKKPEAVSAIPIVGASGMPRWTLRFPWLVTGSFTNTYGDAFNSETSSVTGNPYGKRGNVLYLQLSQGVEMSTGLLGLDTAGARIFIKGSGSDNRNRFWDNYGAAGIEFTYCLGKTGFATFGNTCFFTGGTATQYVDGPDRYPGGRDFRIDTGFRLNLGGYWGQ